MNPIKKAYQAIKRNIEISRERQIIESEEKKRSIINTLQRPWTSEEIHQYNETLLINSAGWIGGNYSEIDCKISYLRSYNYYFTAEEFDELYTNLEKQITRKRQ